MNIMVASDIHGSAEYCGQMLNAFEREGAERLLLLGDILYHGPRNRLPEGYDPQKVAEMLNAICDRIMCVRGNCDSEVDGMVLSFPITAEAVILYAGGNLVYATHGHHALPPHSKNDVILSGHTHMPICEKREDGLYLNPGSISLPKNGSHRGYIMMTDSGFYWRTLGGETYMEYAPNSAV